MTDEKGWTVDELEQQYYIWLTNFISRWRDTHSKLIRQLYEMPFRVTLLMDENRVEDGLALRTRFVYETGLGVVERDMLKFQRPCSILEVMIGLIIRFEEEYVIDDLIEDPIGAWFGEMINSLGLMLDDDTVFDSDLNRVKLILLIFLDRAYYPEGRGGLFYIPGTDEDMTKIELWRQIMMYNNFKGGLV